VKVSDSIPDTSLWWSAHRLRYNVGLTIGGFVAFLLYVTLAWTFADRLNQVEVTGFTIAVQALAFGVVLLIANVCYFVGPLVERLLKPNDVVKFRLTTFNLGFWFSALLPLSLPAAVLYAVVGSA
jgi:hypothetical protein